MGVTSGYKQTEAGTIPAEWEIAAVGSLASFTSGVGISVASLGEESADDPVPVYGGNGVAGFTRRALLREPSVVVGRVGQKCGQVHVTGGPAWVTDNALYPSKLHRPFDLAFLALALQRAGLNDLKNRNDLPLVTQSILHSVRLPWPPDVREQRAIAGALRDVDALIAGLDRLVEKKHDVKQAAMQQLLTGQTRLTGFDGHWQTRPVGALFSIRHGRSQRGIESAHGDYPILGTGGEIGRARQCLCAGPSVLIGRKGTIDRPQYMDTPFWPVDTLFYSVNHGLNDVKFLFYRLCLINWTTHNEGSGVPSLSARTIAGIEFSLPGPPEQTAIAEVLSDMDAELAALEARREKTRALKQAMLQELLTGRIRLV